MLRNHGSRGRRKLLARAPQLFLYECHIFRGEVLLQKVSKVSQFVIDWWPSFNPSRPWPISRPGTKFKCVTPSTGFIWKSRVQVVICESVKSEVVSFINDVGDVGLWLLQLKCNISKNCNCWLILALRGSTWVRTSWKYVCNGTRNQVKLRQTKFCFPMY